MTEDQEHEITVVALNKRELWELINNFNASFEADHPDNVLADKALEKLNTALHAGSGK